ncbi:MAG: hypothetical protein GAK45_02329 [Pseudomonas citronellolis]|nr:MAG: hypothetical protein GAK45_02329 [Pseudomonas citronellolis]
MSMLSAIFYFLSQHYLLSLPLLVLIAAALGALLARWRGHGGWYSLVGVGFVAGMINVFAGSFFNL